jgi:cation diffusion facilitator family transporter
MTDVWTSVGVVIGVAAVARTGWAWLDSVVALLVGANVVLIGLGLMRRSARGLMDRALPDPDQDRLVRILDACLEYKLTYHALRSRQAGSRRFVEFHLLVPGAWTVQHGHDVVERIEARIRAQLPNTTVLIHLEPIEDPASWADVGLDRNASPGVARVPPQKR